MTSTIGARRWLSRGIGWHREKSSAPGIAAKHFVEKGLCELILLCCNFITHHYTLFISITHHYTLLEFLTHHYTPLHSQIMCFTFSAFTGNMKEPVSSSTSRKRCSSSSQTAPKPNELLSLKGFTTPAAASSRKSHAGIAHQAPSAAQVPDFDE